MIKYGVILFPTTSAVMRAEKLMKEMACSIKLIPTPRQFSSDCGIALRFDWSQREYIKAELEKARVDIEAIYLMDK